MLGGGGRDGNSPGRNGPDGNSPDSGGTRSAAYELYHPSVRRWIYDAGWERLRDAQERAAAPILAGDRDLIIATATASRN